jgi:hypothetical protein
MLSGSSLFASSISLKRSGLRLSGLRVHSTLRELTSPCHGTGCRPPKGGAASRLPRSSCHGPHAHLHQGVLANGEHAESA